LLLSVENIFVHYERALVLNDVTLSLNEGEIVAVLGSNGAGKTTLLRSIMGLKRISQGSIRFMGKEIQRLPPHEIVKMGITLCPERRRLFPEMSVLENLELGAYLCRDINSVKKTIEFVFNLFPILKERKNQLAGTLSGGEQQMLAIGRALMSNPKVLMLDEPSLGLSPIVKSNIFKSIKEINSEGVSILLVEQDAVSALKISDRAYVLENGKIVLEGESKDLINNKTVRRAYLGVD